MKPRSVEVRVSRKLSKNYNSTELSFGIAVDLEDTEDPAEVAQWADGWCRDQIREAYAKQNGGSSERSDEGAASD